MWRPWGELLGGAETVASVPHVGAKPAKEKKLFKLPPKAEEMRHVFAYLTKQRYIDSDVLAYFVKQGAIYEDKKHNAVFIGFNEHGVAAMAHKRGTLSDISFRIDAEGSDYHYSFKHSGTSDTVYVFEAPIDMLSYLTLYPDNWQKDSYIALMGISPQPLLHMLETDPKLKEIHLCLDHDPGGIEGAMHLRDILLCLGYNRTVRELPAMKDWNEELKARHGVRALPAKPHPNVEALSLFCQKLSVQPPASNRPYKALFSQCAKYLGGGPENAAQSLNAASLHALNCAVDQYAKAGHQVTSAAVAAHIMQRYKPYMDHSKHQGRMNQIGNAFEHLKRQMRPSAVYSPAERINLARSCVALCAQCMQGCVYYTLAQGQQEQKLEVQEVAMA